MICHCCKNAKATQTVYRNNSGVVGAKAVCNKCAGLSHDEYWELYNKTDYKISEEELDFIDAYESGYEDPADIDNDLGCK